MNLRRWTMIVLFVLLAIVIAGCAATVPQEDYDQVVFDLDAAQASLASTQGQIAELEAELAEAQAQASLTEQELATLREKVDKAAISAEIVDVFIKVGLGSGGDLSEIDAISVFQDLSSMVEDSGDEALQEKFQAVLLSFGGQQETLDLVEYMLGTISGLNQ